MAYRSHLRVYVLGIVLSVVIAGGALGALIMYTTPSENNMLTLAFFAAFFVVAVGLGTLGMTSVWYQTGRQKSTSQDGHSLARAFRHGLLLAMIALGCLILQWSHYLEWWTAALVAAAMLIIELYVVLVRRHF